MRPDDAQMEMVSKAHARLAGGPAPADHEGEEDELLTQLESALKTADGILQQLKSTQGHGAAPAPEEPSAGGTALG